MLPKASASLRALAGALLLTGLTGAIAPAASQDPSPSPSPAPAAVDAIFAPWDRAGSPGCALAVVRDGRIVYENGYGSANLDWDVPITPSTVFYVGSVSKQFTAALVALLAREGRLSLDDDIRRWFPEIPDYGTPVTVRHMIHHMSGIGDTYGLMEKEGMNVADVVSDSAVVALIARQPALDFPPGDRYSYSNGGYFLLSELVERVTGRSFRDVAADRFFTPLGMLDTHFHDRADHVVKRRAMSYAAAGDSGFVQTYLGNFDKVGAGGLYTTVRDLALWDEEFYAQSVGGPGFSDLLRTRGVLASGDTLPYAFGLQHDEHRGQPVIQHTGTMMGFRAYLLRHPERRLTVVTLCNLEEIDPEPLGRRVAELYLDAH